MTEEWRTIAEWPGYEVSNLGRVRTAPGARVQRILRPRRQPDGHLDVRVYTGASTPSGKRLRIHKLVAEAFIERPEGMNRVRHLDGDKHNNCADNLQWCTHADVLANGPNVTLTRGTAENIRRMWEETGWSQAKLAKHFGCSKSAIHCVLNYRTWV